VKKVAIIVPETAVIEAVADPRYLLLAVNQFLSQAGQQPLFEVQLVGQSKEVKSPMVYFLYIPMLLFQKHKDQT
jgi:hypothetical protein